MEFKIFVKNETLTDGMKNVIEEKLCFLDKFLNQDAKVAVTVKVENNEKEIQVRLNYLSTQLIATAKNSDFYIAIDKLVDNLKKQIIKVKNTTKKYSSDKTEYYNENKNNSLVTKIVKRKKFSMKPMSEEEAILEMNILKHESFMFANADLDFIMCLLYKRKDGNYGIIEGIMDEDEE